MTGLFRTPKTGVNMAPNLPSDLPSRFEIPAAWYGTNMANHSELWTYHLTPPEVTELKAAADAFLYSELDIGLLTASAFELPTLQQKFNDVRSELKDGIGFHLIRGLPVDELTPAQIATVFCGIGTHIGALRSQNAQGHMLGHVRDVGADPQDHTTRIYQTNARQTFHTDSSDAVALLCLKDSMEGGNSLLASSVTIYNEIAYQAPELLPRLFDPIATDRRGEVRVGQEPFFIIPVYSWHEGYLTSIYQRQYINSAMRHKAAPRLTKDQTAALDLHDALANDPANHIEMRLKPGDMQFIYNHTMLHDRTGFKDWPNLADRRHLLRLWLSLPEDRPLPESFCQRYGDITIGARGGIVLEDTELNVSLW